MAISFFAYVTTFSGQLYFRRSYLFALRAAVSSEYLLFLTNPFSEQPILRSSQFFRIALFQSKTSAKLPPHENRKFIRVNTFRNSYLFVEGIVQNNDIACFCTASTISEVLHFASTFCKKANFQKKKYFALPSFSGELPFLFRAATFSEDVIIQSSYLLQKSYLVHELEPKKICLFGSLAPASG